MVFFFNFTKIEIILAVIFKMILLLLFIVGVQAQLTLIRSDMSVVNIVNNNTLVDLSKFDYLRIDTCNISLYNAMQIECVDKYSSGWDDFVFQPLNLPNCEDYGCGEITISLHKDPKNAKCGFSPAKWVTQDYCSYHFLQYDPDNVATLQLTYTVEPSINISVASVFVGAMLGFAFMISTIYLLFQYDTLGHKYTLPLLIINYGILFGIWKIILVLYSLCNNPSAGAFLYPVMLFLPGIILIIISEMVYYCTTRKDVY